MKVDWQMIARLIAMLSRVAMDWYRLIENNDNERHKAQKAASQIIDPETPYQDPRELGF